MAAKARTPEKQPGDTESSPSTGGDTAAAGTTTGLADDVRPDRPAEGRFEGHRSATVNLPFVTAQFLAIIGGTVSGEAVQKGRSLFADRMGEQVAAGGVPEEYEQKITSKRIDVPTLGIWGEKDPALLTKLTEGLEEWIPDFRREVLPGAGHWVPYERPGDVNRLIREFVDG